MGPTRRAGLLRVGLGQRLQGRRVRQTAARNLGLVARLGGGQGVRGPARAVPGRLRCGLSRGGRAGLGLGEACGVGLFLRRKPGLVLLHHRAAVLRCAQGRGVDCREPLAQGRHGGLVRRGGAREPGFGRPLQGRQARRQLAFGLGRGPGGSLGAGQLPALLLRARRAGLLERVELGRVLGGGFRKACVEAGGGVASLLQDLQGGCLCASQVLPQPRHRIFERPLARGQVPVSAVQVIEVGHGLGFCPPLLLDHRLHSGQTLPEGSLLQLQGFGMLPLRRRARRLVLRAGLAPLPGRLKGRRVGGS